MALLYRLLSKFYCPTITNQRQTMNANELTATLTEKGFTLEASAPRGEVRDGTWPCISYTVTLKKDGREIYSGPYSLGVGHVDFKKAKAHSFKIGYTTEIALIASGKTLIDNQATASAAAAVAKFQKVAPKLPDVLQSLLLDGSPFFNAESFEGWAGELGYDTDSRKASAMYKTCMETGRALQAALGPDKIKELQELLQDY
jgi:hypothetical protein